MPSIRFGRFRCGGKDWVFALCDGVAYPAHSGHQAETYAEREVPETARRSIGETKIRTSKGFATDADGSDVSENRDHEGPIVVSLSADPAMHFVFAADGSLIEPGPSLDLDSALYAAQAAQSGGYRT